MHCCFLLSIRYLNKDIIYHFIPFTEFLEGIMLSSTRDIAPSCIENVEELIERQEKSLNQLESKRGLVKDLIVKGKQLLENPE